MHLSDPRSTNIETLRVIAVILLVAYHAIGFSDGGALKVGYPHPLRLFADGLIDIRMPLFGFIAGWVYAVRPVERGDLQTFALGKIRRLVVPGIVAASVFWVMATFVVSDAVGAGQSLLNVVSLSYVHFWFLQAILICLIGLAATEAALGRPIGLAGLLIAALALMLLPANNLMPYLELFGAIYLAPFVLMGALFQRHRNMLRQNLVSIAVVAAVFAVLGFSMNISTFLESGVLSSDRRDLQSALTSVGAITLLAVFMPRINALAAVGPAAFTIYLYHVFGTSGMRRAADILGVESLPVLFVLTCFAGIGVPVVAHLLLSRNAITRTLVLGMRPKPTSYTSGSAVPQRA